uniref:Uncharacterized protein n=1 Tax=Hucho hucho TaxID=62062 RepID=A0A4W5NS93_9TELE
PATIVIYNINNQRKPMLKKRDDYEDILEEMRNSCIWNIVHSDHLHYVINQVSQESGEAPDIIQEVSSVILEEMAYRLQISTIHFFAFTLSKAFKTLLQHLQQAIQEHPVVLLPNHCSYMDFLLMSYTYDLALPVIIAAKVGVPRVTSQKFGHTYSFKVCLQEDNMVLKHPMRAIQTELTAGPHVTLLLCLTPFSVVYLSLIVSVFVFSLSPPDHAPTTKVVSSSLALHRSLVCVSGGLVSLVVGEPQGPVTPEETLCNRAVSVLHTAASFKKGECLAVALIYNNTQVLYSFECVFFTLSFILCPVDTDFEVACYLLVKTGAVQMLQQDIVMTDRGQPLLSFFNGFEGLTEKQYIPAVRSFAV